MPGVFGNDCPGSLLQQKVRLISRSFKRLGRMFRASDLDGFELIEVNAHELDAVEDLLLMADQADANALDVSATNGRGRVSVGNFAFVIGPSSCVR